MKIRLERLEKMSKKMTQYSAEFKTKIVLEVLKGDKTINQIASENNIVPKNIINWKKIFLDNASLAMEPARAIKEYKDEIGLLKTKIDEYAKIVGKITVERDWVVGKLKDLDLSSKRLLVESKSSVSGGNDNDGNSNGGNKPMGVRNNDNDNHGNASDKLSLARRCELIELNRASLYYKPKVNEQKLAIKNHIVKTFEEIPSYGYLKVHCQMIEDGFSVSANTVQKYRRELGLSPILAVKVPKTSKANKEHPKYSYKLRGLEIVRANQVWSTDITYIKIKGGMVYMAAIIDWYSKAVLSYRISNVMDSDLVMSVLTAALASYGKPEIFNTDQGSQYTSYIHTSTLRDNDITISMDGKGRATDNIAIERFWRSAKCEMIYLNEYKSVTSLKEDVKEYIEFYNHKRFHQSLGYKKPMNVYYDSLKANDEVLENSLLGLKDNNSKLNLNSLNLDENVA